MSKISRDSVEESAILENQIDTPWMDLSETAAYLKCKERHIRDLVYKRQIPFAKVGRLLRFNRKAVENWMLSKSEERHHVHP